MFVDYLIHVEQALEIAWACNLHLEGSSGACESLTKQRSMDLAKQSNDLSIRLFSFFKRHPSNQPLG